MPIYKSADKDQLKNYRPISLLPAFSKVFEKVMYNKIMNYFDSNNLFYQHQYGFRPKRTTSHPIIQLLNKCASDNNLKPKHLTAAILCDLSKAFDVINHNILIRKLDHYGIRGIAKTWMVNYLTNRKQYVEFGEEKSDHCILQCGVPQGSILGPLLYLIYVNDIAACSDSPILSFADDTTLLVSHNDLDVLYTSANEEISNLYSWFCSNKLSLNPQKTKFIILKPPNTRIDHANHSININNTCLQRVGKDQLEEGCRFLGVYLDENLSWLNHINHISKKISKSLFIMRQVKHILDRKSMKTLYYSLIHPHITYCLLAWGNANKNILKKITILQKRAIRLIDQAQYNSHSEPIFKKLNLLKISDQYELDVVLFMNKFHNKKLPTSFHDMFRYNHEVQASHITRQSKQIYMERCDSQFSRKLPLYNFPILWNRHWGDNMHDQMSHSMLRRLVKSNFIDSYVKVVNCQNPLCRDCGSAQ